MYISSTETENTFSLNVPRNNSIKPVFLNAVDFIMFTDNYKNPLYFKLNKAMNYEITKLSVINNNDGYDSYNTNMDLLIYYCDRYPIYDLVTEIYNDNPLERSAEDTKLLSIDFIPERSQINNEELDYNDCYQMTSYMFNLIFEIENIANNEIRWVMGDHYE